MNNPTAEDKTVRYFDGLSSEWSRKYAADGSMRGRPGRFLAAIQHRVPAGGRLLDFGCGTGEIAAACSRAGYCVEGVDASKPMIERAAAQFPAIPFRALEGESGTLQLPCESQSFDAVVASSVLEYVPDLESCLAELRRVCRAGEWAFFTVPNAWHPWRWLESVAKVFLSAMPFLRTKRLHDVLAYLRLSTNRYSPAGWRKVLERSGWTDVEMLDFGQPLLLIIARNGSGPAESVNR